ncbi:amidohydrolase [Parafrankia colletiae]|uniref:Amidohydrolase n=1 Tax=Parafrankia colletiae TaxID=573497 RepID=A0A1S1RC90_9ACTN|nr:amidohydrolase family protein [Parafrankia colletiae]MCK9900734.1 amidohydrolase family protein [Frankia sp. Cpl3]OHV42424.1 amidohydrolase [Parafrankia colletiae]
MPPTRPDHHPSAPRRVLYQHGHVHSPTTAHATALLVDGATITWIGTATDTPPGGPTPTTIDLHGATVTPAFVDAHVHTTATGLALDGVDLTDTPTLGHALDQLNRAARRRPGQPLLGTGWDETRWPEQRPPTATELTRAAGPVDVYLARADGHTAVISLTLAERSRAPHAPGWLGDGLCRDDAHHRARTTAYHDLPRTSRLDAARRVRTHAAALGIAALHEMGGPQVSSADDLADLLTLARDEPGPAVTGYWAGDLATALDLAAEPGLGPVGYGGDLFVDGSLGSHTAALRAPYHDQPTHHGQLHHDADDIRDIVLDATAAGLQTGFHAIGDAALDTVLTGLHAAAARLGTATIAAARHRVEHAELAHPDQISAMARLGLIASVQPAFDARYGGPDRLYTTRLGTTRAAAMNPFAAYAAAGVTLALSSDSPVTPLDPWGAVHAAAHHHNPAARISTADAFTAATRGGWVAARAAVDGSGQLTAGAPATFAIWDTRPVRRAEAAEAAADPVDAAARTRPVCLRTVLRGQILYDRL